MLVRGRWLRNSALWASNMLAIPWPKARGKPVPPCAPATPTRRPTTGPLSPWMPAFRMRRPHSFNFVNTGVKEILTRLPAADRHPGHGKLLTSNAQAGALHQSSAHTTSGAKQGCGGSRRGALLAPSSAAARWACAQHMLRHLTGRICLNVAAEGRGVSYAAPPCREQRRGVTPLA